MVTGTAQNRWPPGQFWYAFNFSHDAIILKQELQISVPRDRPLKWKSPDLKPLITEEGMRRVFTWTSSQPERKPSEEDQKEQEENMYRAARGQLHPPEVQISSFKSWEEVGRWYGSLQQERVKPTAEIRSKADELTKDVSNEEMLQGSGRIPRSSVPRTKSTLMCLRPASSTT